MLKKALGGALVVLAVAAAACAQERGSSGGSSGESSGSDAAKAAASASAGPMTPIDRVAATKQGELKNPYKDDNADIVAQGQKLFMHSGCNGCHGGNGGGGMCPPLTNDTWVYGGDDDTLFRLVTLGTDELQKKGYSRKGHENVVGPMPPHGAIVKTDDDLWKIITFIRSNYHGSPSKKFGDQPDAAAP